MPSQAFCPQCCDSVDAGCFLVLLERLFWLRLPFICSSFRRLRHINRSHTQKMMSDKKVKPKEKDKRYVCTKRRDQNWNWKCSLLLKGLGEIWGTYSLFLTVLSPFMLRSQSNWQDISVFWGCFFFWYSPPHFMAGARQLVGPYVNRMDLPGGIIKAGHLSQSKLGENKVAFLAIMAPLTCFIDAVREEI